MNDEINDKGFHKEAYTSYELQAIIKYTKATSSSYDPVNHTLVLKGTDIAVPDKENIKIIANEFELEDKKQVTLETITTLAKTLTADIKKYLTGKVLTVDQLERYEAKAQAVADNNVDFFKEEAELLGKDPQVLFDDAKAKVTAWKTAFNLALGKIDALRVKLETLVEDKQIDFVTFIINDVKTMKIIDTTTNLVDFFKDVKVKYTNSLKS